MRVVALITVLHPNGSSNQGGSLNPNITANKRVYDFGVLDLKKEQEKIRLKITELTFKKQI